MISNNSRYSDSILVTIIKRNNSNAKIITPSPAKTYTFNYVFHRVLGVERVDNIAYAYYNDATKWWKIADANPEIMDFSNIPTGTVLRVPNV